jgi:hypothetical protein
MSARDFVSTWRRWFPTEPPIGHVLREACHDRWFRIHSLPNARRYPETEPEFAELLRRHKAVATELLGEGRRCFLAVRDDPGERESWTPACLALPFSSAMDVPANELTGEDACVIQVSEGVWTLGAYEPIVRDIAEDRGPRVLWLAPETGGVYAPYDGGADFILPDRAQRDALAVRYRDWAGTGPGGL